MPKIYKSKDQYYFKIPAYNDMEDCEINNKKFDETNKPTYSDVPESMFSIMCALIIDFVEGEDPIAIVDWDWTEDHAKCRDEFMKLYKFAKVWPKYENRINDMYLHIDWSGGERHCSIWGVYEEKMIQLQDQFMMRMINIRMGLWT